MKHKQLTFKTGFRPACTVRQVQAAEMTLAPGERTGGPDNRHRGADQWLYVVSGTGRAVVDGEDIRLKAGTLLVIERGEAHAIHNTGRQPLQTLNLYSPPAYEQGGDPLPAGED